MISSPALQVIDIDSTQESNVADNREQESDEQELCKCFAFLSIYILLNYNLERLQETWHSPVYSFFKPHVEIGHDHGCKFHLFRCAAKRCKGSGVVWQYLDSKVRAGTSNLRAHAHKCFGAHVVDVLGKKGKPGMRDGSVFAAFARHGQQPIMISHCSLTSDETQ